MRLHVAPALLIASVGGACDDNPAKNDFHSSGAPSDGYQGERPEATGLTLGPGGEVTIAGTIDGARADETRAASAMFVVTVAQAALVRAELTWTGGATSDHAVAILAPDFSPVAWPAIGNTGRVISRPVSLAPGDYVIHVGAALPAPPATESFLVTVTTRGVAACEAKAGPPDHAQAPNAAPGVSAASVTWPAYPALAPAGGSAEDTAIDLASDGDASIAGAMAAIGFADDYRDRATFHFTATTAKEVIVRADPDPDANADLDLFLVDAGDLSRLRASGVALDTGAEIAVAPVEPGRSYWLWVGSHDQFPDTQSAAYRVTLCGR